MKRFAQFLTPACVFVKGSRVVVPSPFANEISSRLFNPLYYSQGCLKPTFFEPNK